jgi:hypothetical protein
MVAVCNSAHLYSMTAWAGLIWRGLLLAPLALASCERDRHPPAPPNVELVKATPIDVEDIAGINGPDLAGKRVQVGGALVQELVTDRVFWIGPSPEQRVLVVMPGGSTGRLDVQPGQRVNLTGTVERVPSAPDGLRRLDLPAAGEDLLRLQVVYLQAGLAGSTVQAE